jgi:predicted kinase
VESFLLDLPEVSDREQRAAAKRARRYFDLAVEYASSLPPAFLVITCGLSASGKSTVAAELASALGASVLSSDVVRKQMAGMDPDQPAAEEYRAGIYSADATERTYEAMLDAARPVLIEGKSVILDASFLRRPHRKAAASLARETGAQFACVFVRAGESAVRRRFEERLRSRDGPSDARWDIYQQQKRRFQKPSEVEPQRLIEVDTTRRGSRYLGRALARLRALSPHSVPG